MHLNNAFNNNHIKYALLQYRLIILHNASYVFNDCKKISTYELNNEYKIFAFVEIQHI